MPAIFAFFASPLGKVVLQLLVLALQKTGLANWAERLLITFGSEVVGDIENAKVEYTYPTGKNGQTETSRSSSGTENGNYNHK